MKHPIDGIEPSSGQAQQPVGSWSRADFEAALPLYVGGDLEADECDLVEGWVAEHVADRPLLDAAMAAQGALQAHARSTVEGSRAIESPDLWPAVRAGLVESGALVGDRARHVARPRATAAVGGHASVAPRWFQRRSFAAAAAVLLCAGVTGMLVSTGGGDLDRSDVLRTESGVAAGVNRVASSSSLPSGALGVRSQGGAGISPLAGGAAHQGSMMLAGDVPVRQANGGVRLYRPAPDVPQMIVDTSREFPAYQMWEPAMSSSPGPQLTSGGSR